MVSRLRLDYLGFDYSNKKGGVKMSKSILEWILALLFIATTGVSAYVVYLVIRALQKYIGG